MAAATKYLPTAVGSAKAYGHFEGSDATLDASLNTASLTDSGPGDFSPQIGNDMASVNYATVTNAVLGLTTASCSDVTSQTYAAGSFNIVTSHNGSNLDRDDTTYYVHGDLA